LPGRLSGLRALVTTADLYLGPPIVDAFRQEGADVIADESDYSRPGAVEAVVESAGRVDILVGNFAGPRHLLPFDQRMLSNATDIRDDDFQALLDVLVWPMVRFVRAVLPQMYERRSGRICGVTSASPQKAIPGLSTYIACRAAQNAFLRVASLESAPHNVLINAIAPAYIENNAYFGKGMLDDPAVRQQVEAMTPAGVLGTGADAAQLVTALVSDAGNFVTGQIIPVSGGWEI
jgi:2-keto-3-deoxy-L-fuconate dehydrogenase